MLNRNLKSLGLLIIIIAVVFTLSACDMGDETTTEEEPQETHTLTGFVNLQGDVTINDVILEIGDSEISPEDDGSWEVEVDAGDTVTITPQLVDNSDDYFWYSDHTDWQEEDEVWVDEVNDDIEGIVFNALHKDGISGIMGYSFIAGDSGAYYAQQEKIGFTVRIHDNTDGIITDNIELTELYIGDVNRTEDSKIEFSHVHGDEKENSDWDVIIENVEELPQGDAEISFEIEHTETDTKAKFTNTWNNIRQEEFDEGISSTHSFIGWNSGVHDQVDDVLNYVIGLTSVEEEAITSPEDIDIVSHSIDGEDYTEDTQLEFDFEADGGAGIWNVEVENVDDEPDEESDIELVLEHVPTGTQTALYDHWGSFRDEEGEHYNIKFTDGTADELNPMGYFDVEVEVTNIGYVDQDSILGIPIRVADKRDWDWDEFLFYHRELYVAEDLSPGESTIVENEYVFGAQEEEVEADEYELIAEINEYTEDNGDYGWHRSHDATFKEINIGEKLETTKIDEGTLDATDVDQDQEQKQDIFFELEQISDDNAAATNWMGIRWGEDIEDIETEEDVYTDLISGLDDLADGDVTIHAGDEEINAEIDHEYYTSDEHNYLNLYLPEPLADIAGAGDEVTVEISDGLNFSEADSGDYDIRVNLFHGHHRLDRELSEETFSVR